MSRPAILITSLCISLVLVSLLMIAGCTTTPSGPGGTTPVTTLPATTASLVPTVSPEQSSYFQLKGNVYGLSSNPLTGIDTIMLTIGSTSQAPVIDLTRMEIVFSTPGTAPVTLTQSTSDTLRTFTTTLGNNPVNSLRPGDQVEIDFRVKVVPGGTKVNIELRPPVGAALPVSRIVPEVISSTTVLN
jgi:archaellin